MEKSSGLARTGWQIHASGTNPIRSHSFQRPRSVIMQIATKASIKKMIDPVSSEVLPADLAKVPDTAVVNQKRMIPRHSLHFLHRYLVSKPSGTCSSTCEVGVPFKYDGLIWPEGKS